MVEEIIIHLGNTGVCTTTRTLYIGRDIKHFGEAEENIKLMDICLDHETLHIVLSSLGERNTSDNLDIGIPSILIEDLRVGLEGFEIIK